MPAYDDKTPMQEREALDEAEAILGEALERARTRLRAAGVEHNPPREDGDFGCDLCDCAHFQRSGPTSLKCKRPSCGHSFFRHRVF